MITSDQRISIEVSQSYKLAATITDTGTETKISRFYVFKL